MTLSCCAPTNPSLACRHLSNLYAALECSHGCLLLVYLFHTTCNRVHVENFGQFNLQVSIFNKLMMLPTALQELEFRFLIKPTPLSSFYLISFAPFLVGFCLTEAAARPRGAS